MDETDGYLFQHKNVINTSLPCEAIYDIKLHHRVWSMVQVMACCLTALSHYLNLCWLIISEVLWHLLEGNFAGNVQEIYPVLLQYGHQMRPMDPPGDPRSYHRWSVWRPVDSLGFAENVLEWKWRDYSIDALISNVRCALVKCRPRLVHFDHFLIGCMVSADYWLADCPELRRATQPSVSWWSIRRARILHFLQHCPSLIWVWKLLLLDYRHIFQGPIS